MSQTPVGRRQLLRFLGAGALLGTAGTAAGSTDGDYIVGTRSRAAERAARAEAASIRRTLDFGPFGGAVAGRFSKQALRGLSRRPDVAYVEPDGRMYAIAVDSGDSEVPWGVDRVDAEVSHAGGATGAGASVAVIDTGIDNDHPDLAGNLGHGVSFTVGSWRKDESSTDPADWNDDNGHGTHCAGTVGAVDDGRGVVGVAPGVTLHAVKVLDQNGSGYWSDVAAGIEWAGTEGVDVASMSLGGGYSSTIDSACAYAASQGVFLVAAAGNDGPNTADSHYPGALATVMAVGATDRYDRIASFSSTGDAVEIAAPGVAIPSTWYGGGYNTISGTSMACPHVAGAGALLRAAGLTAGEARSRLGGTAEDIGLNAKQAGAGLLDVPAALGGTTTDPGDTTAPAAPTDLSVTDTTTESVSLAWTASSSSDVAGYRVYRDGSAVGETVDTAYTDSGLAADTGYTYGVTAFDDAGNESGATETQATTDPASSGGGGSAPTGSVSATEGRARGPHATFVVDWDASDADGDLSTVDLVLLDGSAVEESTSVAVSGGAASGSVELKAHKDGGSGRTYTVELTVTDAAGATGTASATVTEDGR